MSSNTNNTSAAAATASATVDPHMPPVISDVAASTTHHNHHHHNHIQPQRPHQSQLAGHHAALSSIFSNFLDNLSSKLPPPAPVTLPSTRHLRHLRDENRTSSTTTSASPTPPSGAVVQPPGKNMRRTSDLLETLQQALSAPPPMLANLQLPQRNHHTHHHHQNNTSGITSSSLAGASLGTVTDAPVSRVVEKNVPCFGALVEIIAATGIVRTFVGQQKPADDSPPSSYVTFEARGHEPPFADLRVIQSPDGAVFATTVVANNASPEWRQQFEAVQLPVELLSNPSKRFVIKVWCKTHTLATAAHSVATPNADSLVGYAVVNLSQLPAESPSICEWINVTDVFGRVNGRLQLRIGVSDAAVVATHCRSAATRRSAEQTPACCDGSGGADTTDMVSEYSEVLNQTIKRKFTELEDITKRLKARLGDVTDDAHFEDILDEFENDLNTMPDETEAESAEFDWLMMADDGNGDDGETVMLTTAERMRGASAEGRSGARDECHHLIEQLYDTSLTAPEGRLMETKLATAE